MEIGVRMAHGAAPRAIVTDVLTRVLRIVGVGTAVGVVVSLWTSTLVGSLLYGLHPHDLPTIASAIAILGAVGVLAGWIPAVRASHVDPAEVLREG